MPLEIVYLDDESDLCETFIDNFATADVHVTTFVDPDAAIAHVAHAPPDLLFLDYRPPTTTGDAVAMLIDATIPKVLLTGDLHVRPDYPFVGVFHKPFSVTEVATFIAAYVSRVKPTR